MRNIYLVRHGQPEFPGSKRFCLSRTDLPLSIPGRLQAALLGQYFRGLEQPVTVFHSGLTRTRQTAEAIDPKPLFAPGLEELGIGQWEGLPFDEIRRCYPDLYEQRGRNPYNCVMPGGEAPADCQKRGLDALYSLVRCTDGDLVIVAHAGINRLILNALTCGEPNGFLNLPQPYGCVNHLTWDGRQFSVTTIGKLPHPVLDGTVIKALWDAAGTLEPVRQHCAAVAQQALELVFHLADKNKVDSELLTAAALLHDIARTEPDHPAVGAAWLEMLGYPQIADTIVCHHDLEAAEESRINEKTLLHLADKYICGTRTVSLEERFAVSAAKLSSNAAQAAHRHRYEQARWIEGQYQSACKEA